MSLRASPLSWRGNPPDEWDWLKVQNPLPSSKQEENWDFTARQCTPFNRGAATPVCGLVRSDI